ncbi:MAG: hypothetical protein RL095_1736 [Verrucomicrobiota bacterium]|jgi:hypothetical protein
MSAKSKPMHSLQIPIDHLAAAHEYDCELEFLALIRRCCRIRGPVKAQGLEELINDGVVLRAEDGLIPACVAETLAYIEGQTSAGFKGADRRKSLKTEATLEAPCSAAAASPKPASSQSKAMQDKQDKTEAEASSNTHSPAGEKPPGKPAREVGYSTDFESFWEQYPRKVGKGEAWKAWQARAKPLPAPETLLTALGQASVSEQWRRDGGKYIPHPATWLNGRRWEDQMQSPPAAGMTQSKLADMLGF